MCIYNDLHVAVNYIEENIKENYPRGYCNPYLSLNTSIGFLN